MSQLQTMVPGTEVLSCGPISYISNWSPGDTVPRVTQQLPGSSLAGPHWLVTWTRWQGDLAVTPLWASVLSSSKGSGLNETRQFLESSKATRSTYCTQSGWDTGVRRSLVLVSNMANLASDSSHGAYPMGRSRAL